MATVAIRNSGDLVKVFEVKVSSALIATRNEIYNVVQKHIAEYYKEKVFRKGKSCIPSVYERTFKYLNSLIKTEVICSGLAIYCTVEVDPVYLVRVYEGGATGKEVWDWANERSHGGKVSGDLEVWNDAMDELGGNVGIKQLMISNLKKRGIPIK